MQKPPLPRWSLAELDDRPALQQSAHASHTSCWTPVVSECCSCRQVSMRRPVRHVSVLVSLGRRHLVEKRLKNACATGPLALGDGEVAAAVVPDYLPPLLVGCGKVEPGAVRVLAKTLPVPGVRLFRTGSTDDALAKRVAAEVTALAKRKDLLAALESANGFVKPPGQAAAWVDWRGSGRLGQASSLPKKLPEALRKIWSAKLTGPAVAGPAATATHVIIPDKNEDATRDLFRCLDAADGSEVWRLDSHNTPLIQVLR